MVREVAHLAVVHLWGLLALGSLLGDIGGWLTGAAGKVRDLARATWQSIKHLWSVVGSVFRKVGGAWASLYTDLGGALGALERFARSVYTLGRWLAEHVVPKRITQAIGQALGYARRLATRLVDGLAGRVASIYRYLRRRVDGVASFASGLRRWAFSEVATIRRYLFGQVRRAVDLLGHPDRLVAWVLPSLVVPLLRFIYAHSQALGLWVGRLVVRNLPGLVKEAEDVLSKIL